MSEGYTYTRTPAIGSTKFTSGLQGMENHAILSLQGPKKMKKYTFRELPVVRGVYISQHNLSKSSLAVILRGQPTFYGQRCSRYGFWAILRLLVQFWPKNGFRQPFSLITKSIVRINSEDSETSAVLLFRIIG